ncbi:MAG: DNA polymerase III subunit gamma/tau [Candidatus Omnitrophica bacterium]|nr:DNA polymerase III subunit gamma/tau [Candidatus Omnitrophota bacterium]
MAYLSLARKYRPQNFDEIVGQAHIATTLKNAISQDKVAHAYLFTGSRGVGKTSTARILAIALNCEKGPTNNPCGKCVACTEIKNARSLDVIEIDGASNRGIDEIRNLKENTRFSPMSSRFKIYIIDEVHMLTPEAFNALLKTLEEPPAHVKFIFATTQPHKVLPTVMSRCQRFDFRRIPAQGIVAKLKEIKTKEKINLKDEAVFLVAKAADGSLRDAEVMLDQLSSFAKGKIEAADVVEMLGLLESRALFDIAEALVKNEKEKILEDINALIDSGKDPAFIASSLVEHFRNMMVVKVAEKKSAYLVLSEEDFTALAEQAKSFSLDEILYVIYALARAIELIKKTSLGRIPLEVALVKLTEKSRFTDIKEIMDRISSIKPTSNYARRVEKITSPVQAPESAPEEAPKNAPKDVPKEAVSAEKDILSLQKIKLNWQQILTFIKQKKMSVATFLRDGEPVRVENSALVIGFGPASGFHKDALDYNANKDIVCEAVKTFAGEDLKIKTEMLDREVIMEEALSLEEAEEVPEETASSRKIDPIVEAALDKFDGKIASIEKIKKEKK